MSVSTKVRSILVWPLIGRTPDRFKATQDVCIASAKRIFEPYQVDFGYVDWFSVVRLSWRCGVATDSLLCVVDFFFSSIRSVSG
jgi:hypothetical protein